MNGAKKILIADVDQHAGAWVNLVGIVVHRGRGFAVLDDQSGLVKIILPEGREVKLGAPLLVIGMVQNGCVFANVARELLSTKWLLVRRLELGAQAPVQEEPLSYERLIEEIRALDSGEGVLLEELYKRVGARAEELVMNLLAEGEIYENRPGRVRVLD